MVQKGHFLGTEFSTEWGPEDFIEDGEPIEIAATTYSTKPYICEGVLAITYASGWILTSADFAHEYGLIPNQWAYFAPNITLDLINSDSSWSGRYYCANTGTPA